MRTLAINDTTGYVLYPLQWVTGIEACRVSLVQALRLWEGEWFLDTREGMPYRRHFLRKNPNINLCKAIIRRALGSRPGVKEVLSVGLEFDKRTRQFSVSFSARVAGEDEIVTVTKEPFIPGRALA